MRYEIFGIIGNDFRTDNDRHDIVRLGSADTRERVLTVSDILREDGHLTILVRDNSTESNSPIQSKNGRSFVDWEQ